MEGEERMSETAMIQKNMYEEVPGIRDLNNVEGFDPRRYMRVIQGEGEAAKYYLDVAFRKLWFRLKYPEGKIVKKIVKLTDQLAIVEAKVYLNRNDSEDSFISNALAQKYFSADDQFGSKYVELAETAAVGRALSDAGFGLQFADREEEPDPQVTDAPFDAGMLFGKGSLPEGTYMEEDGEVIGSTGNGVEDSYMEAVKLGVTHDNLPGQHEIGEYITLPGSADIQKSQMSGMTPAMQQPAGQKISQGNPISGKNAADKGKQADGQAGPGIRKDMPVEQIYPMLSRDSAAAVVISAGYHKGKTLGQLAVEKPNGLDWYVSSYGGPDNLLRAAAKYLLDLALKQAG